MELRQLRGAVQGGPQGRGAVLSAPNRKSEYCLVYPQGVWDYGEFYCREEISLKMSMFEIVPHECLVLQAHKMV